MKFVVTKITQKEESILVDAVNEADAFDHFYGYDANYPETKTQEITKITVTPVPVETLADEAPSVSTVE